ncbi:MAG: PhzF family phenazine biosynthesis protein [Phycisphaeraceae bacterium]|nr:PhzF family phenazine biosynthesis protein [Phycisphaeraceae bacterium]MCW5753874.1 PhzF family phenazine biosynthesis protein [Phycisphaeraceae bacterium]
MPTLRLFHVDAFTERTFCGNPAAVVPLEAWPEDDLMQHIAHENNLAETAFFVPRETGAYDIRWFTPTTEVDLCGHATLASAHVLWKHLGVAGDNLVFHSRSGALPVARDRDMLVLDFPARPAASVPVTPEIAAALGRMPAELYQARDYMAVFENKRDVHELVPDMAALAAIASHGFIVTAPATRHDFVCRFFAPAVGVPEDSVTGSAHCTLVPFWAKRLGKSSLTSHQVSRRGGELFCQDRGDRILIGGRCADYLTGQISV